jgi:hypothetical protein
METWYKIGIELENLLTVDEFPRLGQCDELPFSQYLEKKCNAILPPTTQMETEEILWGRMRDYAAMRHWLITKDSTIQRFGGIVDQCIPRFSCHI